MHFFPLIVHEFHYFVQNYPQNSTHSQVSYDSNLLNFQNYLTDEF